MSFQLFVVGLFISCHFNYLLWVCSCPVISTICCGSVHIMSFQLFVVGLFVSCHLTISFGLFALCHVGLFQSNSQNLYPS